MSQERFDYEVTRQLQENQMETKVISISPSVAAQLLEGNKSNRRISDKTVHAYAGLMERGAWRLNGESIKVAKDGTLLDGQHRLTAIIKAGVAVDCLLITGLETKVFDTIDQGKKRTFADVLSIKGDINTNTLAAVVRMAYCLDCDSNPVLAKSVPIDILEQYLEENPNLRVYANHGKSLGKICEGSIVGALWHLFARKDAQAADDFFARLHDGADLSFGSPIRLLRDRLTLNRVSNTQKTPLKVIAALIIKAWNAHRLGKEIKQLYWKETEEFPKII